MSIRNNEQGIVFVFANSAVVDGMGEQEGDFGISGRGDWKIRYQEK